MRVVTICCLLFLLCGAAMTQESANASIDRSRLSIMVVPFTSGQEDVLKKLESDEGYKAAISAINSALIDMGYRNTLDFKGHKEMVDKRHAMTQNATYSASMKTYIEEAPSDVIVEAEIIWTDPPGNPRYRQARVKLKALDKYTGAVYADNSFIQSNQREFPGLAVAVNHALTKDGAPQFKVFLDQLDASYRGLLKEGRAVNVKFELDTKSRVTLNDRVGSERLSDKLEECLQKLAFAGRYRALGSSEAYMDFTVQVPIIENGVFVSPNIYLRKKVDAYFYELGFDVNVSQLNNWINFILLKKNAQPQAN